MGDNGIELSVEIVISLISPASSLFIESKMRAIRTSWVSEHNNQYAITVILIFFEMFARIGFWSGILSCLQTYLRINKMIDVFTLTFVGVSSSMISPLLWISFSSTKSTSSYQYHQTMISHVLWSDFVEISAVSSLSASCWWSCSCEGFCEWLNKQNLSFSPNEYS